MIRLFLDANVLFSVAYNADSRCGQLLAVARAYRMSLYSSRYCMDEAKRNITKKAPMAQAHLVGVFNKINIAPEGGTEQINMAQLQMIHPKDAPVLAAAIALHADVLVTADKAHFGHLYNKHIYGVTIVSPQLGLKWILDQI